jgi:hypothetical protein
MDCDVLQADGGTRTAAITGAYVALHLALQKLVERGVLSAVPLHDTVAAVSCGIHQGTAVLDLDYAEDSAAEADANFVLTAAGGIVALALRPLADVLAIRQRAQQFVARRGKLALRLRQPLLEAGDDGFRRLILLVLGIELVFVLHVPTQEGARSPWRYNPPAE